MTRTVEYHCPNVGCPQTDRWVVTEEKNYDNTWFPVDSDLLFCQTCGEQGEVSRA